jgi:hypothetical protein
MHESDNFYHDPWAEAKLAKQRARQAAEEAERHRETWRHATAAWGLADGDDGKPEQIESSHDVGAGLAELINEL